MIGVPFILGIAVAHFFPRFAAKGAKIVEPAGLRDAAAR